jgi:hypothetical protein
MPRVIEQAAITVQSRKDRAVLRDGFVGVRFTKNGDSAKVVRRIPVSLQRLPSEICRSRQPAFIAVPIYEKRLLDFV